MGEQEADRFLRLLLPFDKRFQKFIQTADIDRQPAVRRDIVVETQQIPHRVPDVLRRLQHQKFASLSQKEFIVLHAVAGAIGSLPLKHIHHRAVGKILFRFLRITHQLHRILGDLRHILQALPKRDSRVLDRIQNILCHIICHSMYPFLNILALLIRPD